MARPGTGPAWGALLTGLASTITLPLAIYLTRFNETYELLHSGFAIPLSAGLGVVSLGLARRSRLRGALAFGGGGGRGIARAGRVLAIVGLCLSAAAIVALGVYGLLEYVGSRD